MAYTRREFVKTVGAASLGAFAAPYLALGQTIPDVRYVPFGSTNFDVTRFGLGGQASIQWTPDDESPVDIILKAHHIGVNYFDTSNIYDKSQMHYGAALRHLHMNPGLSGYDEKARRSVFLASKTRLRFCKGGFGEHRGGTQGRGKHTLDDLRRSLSQIFGNGEGDYPDGAYLDCMQIHSLWTMAEIDAIYHNIDNPEADDVGALAALLDVRDGTNMTGLNPKHEKLIRHIGLTGHFSSPVLMEGILRDNRGIFDTLLVAINANDRLNLNHQYNVIPMAAAKGMGVIGMKVFADGAMYTKGAHWTRGPQEVVRTIGDRRLPSHDLITYSLSTPGVTTAIMGIGHIDDNPEHCQLEQDLADASATERLAEVDRREIEERAAEIKDGATNWFQARKISLTPPRNVRLERRPNDSGRRFRLTWDTSYSDDEPIIEYGILRDNQRVGAVPHKPQLSYDRPFTYEFNADADTSHTLTVAAVDRQGRVAVSKELIVRAGD